MKDVSNVITHLTPCLKHVFFKTKQEKKTKKKRREQD
jgi:hypothetical protein